MADRSCLNCKFCKKVSEDGTGLLIIYRCQADGYFEMEEWQRDCYCCDDHRFVKRYDKDAE